jgi:hypothetical protein
MYISIGDACVMKYQIDKHKSKKETLFFDWLMTSMTSVIEILSCRNINLILNYSNITRDENDPIFNNNSRVVIHSLDYCVSIHDIDREFKHEDILSFIDKCKRRYNRLIEYIKSYEKIIFLRDGPVTDTEKNKFIRTIQKLNPKCNFVLVVVDNNIDNKESMVKSDHCLYIKLNIAPPNNNDWTKSYLDFPNLFSIIESNT